MSKWEIVKDDPYALLKDGREVLSGTWSDCKREMLAKSLDNDRVTPGPAIVDVRAGTYRRIHNERARACGLHRLAVK